MYRHIADRQAHRDYEGTAFHKTMEHSVTLRQHVLTLKVGMLRGGVGMDLVPSVCKIVCCRPLNRSCSEMVSNSKRVDRDLQKAES